MTALETDKYKLVSRLTSFCINNGDQFFKFEIILNVLVSSFHLI